MDETYRVDSYVDNTSYICQFQNGSLKNDFCATSECDIYSDGKSEKLCTAGLVNGLFYLGEEDEDELYDTALVVINKKTGKVRLLNASNMILKAVTEEVKKDTQKKDKLDLSRKFGSKKKKTYMELKEKFKVNVDTVKEQMNDSIVNTSVNVETLSSYMGSESVDQYIPPMNKEAENVKDVFKLEDLLSSEQISYIVKEYEGCDPDVDLLPYVSNLYKHVKEDWEIACLLYVNGLITFYKASYQNMKKKTYSVSNYSETINSLVLDNFSQMGTKGLRTRSDKMKDKMLCYIIVLLLLVTNFKFELDPFTAVIHISVTNVILKSKLVGARISDVNEKKYIVLKLPLNKPGTSGRRKSSKF